MSALVHLIMTLHNLSMERCNNNLSILTADSVGTCVDGSPVISGCINGACGGGFECLDNFCCSRTTSNELSFSSHCEYLSIFTLLEAVRAFKVKNFFSYSKIVQNRERLLKGAIKFHELKFPIPHIHSIIYPCYSIQFQFLNIQLFIPYLFNYSVILLSYFLICSFVYLFIYLFINQFTYTL